MKTQRTILHAAVTIAACAAFLSNAQVPERSVMPKEVQNLVATAEGRWTSYGLNADGEIAKQSEYRDELATRDLKVEGGRAFVTYTAKMHFPGQQEPFIMEGKESADKDRWIQFTSLRGYHQLKHEEGGK